MKNILFIILSMLMAVSCLPEKQTQGKKVLLVVTNHEKLGDTGKTTGYFLSEVTHPYYKFVEAGLEVDFASPKGGAAPMDPKSLDLKDSANEKFYENKDLMKRLETTQKLSEVPLEDYAAIFFAGGHGTMWDFPDSESVQQAVRTIYEKGGVVAAVCHGPAALVNVKLSDGSYLLSERKATGFTNKEEDLVELSDQMPFMLEDKMKERKAMFRQASPWEEKVVVDGRLVTGQNPASASLLGKEVVKLIKGD